MKQLPKKLNMAEVPDRFEIADINEAQQITLNALKLSNFKKKNASVNPLQKGLSE